MKRSISKKSLAALAIPLALLYLRRSHSRRKPEVAKKRAAPRLLGGALGTFLAGGAAGYGVGRRRPDARHASEDGGTQTDVLIGAHDGETQTDVLIGAHDGETPAAGYISDAIQQTLGSLSGWRKKKRKNARILRRPTTRADRHSSQDDSDNSSSWSTKWTETRQQMTRPTSPMNRRRRRIIKKLRDETRNTAYFDLSGGDTELENEYETDWVTKIGESGLPAVVNGPSQPASSSPSWPRNTPINPRLNKPTSFGVSVAPNVAVSGDSATEKMRKKLEARRV